MNESESWQAGDLVLVSALIATTVAVFLLSSNAFHAPNSEDEPMYQNLDSAPATFTQVHTTHAGQENTVLAAESYDTSQALQAYMRTSTTSATR